MMGYGYLLVTITEAISSPKMPPMMRIEFHSPGHNDGLPADSCVLNLETHELM
jgi:hypothetical protein